MGATLLLFLDSGLSEVESHGLGVAFTGSFLEVHCPLGLQ